MLYQLETPPNPSRLTAAADIIDVSMRHMIHPPASEAAPYAGAQLNARSHSVAQTDLDGLQRHSRVTTATATASPPEGVPVTHSVDWKAAAAQTNKLGNGQLAEEPAAGILMEVCECWSGVPGCYQGWSQWPPAGCSKSVPLHLGPAHSSATV